MTREEVLDLVSTGEDASYVEHLDMGVRNRIIRSRLAHDGTEPDIIVEAKRPVVRGWKDRKPS